MLTEQRLADAIFAIDPLPGLTDLHFQATDRKQVRLFHQRLIAQTEARLDDQFGASLALIAENSELSATEVARLFVASPAFRAVREDLDAPEVRFEYGFVSFVTDTFDGPWIAELEQILLLELRQI